MKRMLIVVALCTMMCLPGCGRGGDSDTDGKPTIALVLKTLNNPYFVDLRTGAEKAAEALDVNLVVQAGERETDPERQMQIIENLIQTGPDAFCITPSGSAQLLPAIAKANRAGIPVIIIDQRIDEDEAQKLGIKTETFIGSDNYTGGQLAAQYLVERLNGEAKLAILEGTPGQESSLLRHEGFLSGLQGHPGMEIVASQTANFERNQGFNVFQNVLTANSEIEALFAANDMMALGAIEAIRAAGKTGDIVVVGFDAIADARAAIQEGTMAGSIAQYPSEIGRLAVENAVKLLNGESLPAYTPVKIEMITKDKL